MSFAGKLVNVAQAAVLTVVSSAIVLVLAGTTVWGGSRAADWAFGLPKNTSITWLGNHAQQIAYGANTLANMAIATGFHSGTH